MTPCMSGKTPSGFAGAHKSMTSAHTNANPTHHSTHTMVGARLRYGSCVPKKPVARVSRNANTARHLKKVSKNAGTSNSLTRGRRTSLTNSAITAKVTTSVAPAPLTHSHNGSGKSKRWPKPCAAPRAAAHASSRLSMHSEIKEGAMMRRAVRVLRHREARGNACGELHACGRVRRHRGFEVIAMQMQHDAPVARPAQLDQVALRDAQRAAPG